MRLLPRNQTLCNGSMEYHINDSYILWVTCNANNSVSSLAIWYSPRK